MYWKLVELKNMILNSALTNIFNRRYLNLRKKISIYILVYSYSYIYLFFLQNQFYYFVAKVLAKKTFHQTMIMAYLGKIN